MQYLITINYQHFNSYFQLAASSAKNDSRSKAIGFLKLFRSRDIVMALFLGYVLTLLHKVSLKFQEESSVVADVSLTIKTMLARIKSFARRFHFLNIFQNVHYRFTIYVSMVN